MLCKTEINLKTRLRAHFLLTVLSQMFEARRETVNMTAVEVHKELNSVHLNLQHKEYKSI